MSAPDEILTLVEHFSEHSEAYKAGKYNEAQVRKEFIDPMFKALGWDIDNSQGYAEQYKDVIHEDSIRVAEATKAPDYCFRIGGVRKFFLEAKKPSVFIKEAIHPAYQLRRYAWSAKLPLSVLTDFEEFAIYDCRVRPDAKDKASTARINYIYFTEYPHRWDEIAGIFSRDAVLKGAFDKHAATDKKKRGTAEVDDAFLEEIEGWRDLLAKNIHLRNKNLAIRELNRAVQVTIDRIVFLRICEARGIEPYAQLQAFLNGGDTYDRLKTLFHRADDRYNSGLFHFKKEKGREDYDQWTLKLVIDDKPLKDILKRLYYPDSPYEFAVLPADILGQVYEQFLGKVITPKGRAIAIEEKPEVKKAGGVYYTPTYIVEYIVENTVGKLLEGLSPDDAMGQGRKKESQEPIRVLDPACGSGSFLLGAYQFLLDWYLARYAEAPEKHAKGKAPRIVQVGRATRQAAAAPKAAYRLTTPERKRILLDHIYGVDIDPQAVEVTKLSLLLKCLEGETQESLEAQLSLFHQRALPDLDGNIKCGNSLIGPDFYSGQQLDAFDEEERYRINAFDWKKEFAEIMKSGGFDAVIGNPPYVNAWGMTESSPTVRRYVNERANFETADKHWDLYILFLERAWQIARTGGRFSFIIPYSVAIQKYARKLREFLLERTQIESIMDLRTVRVFGKVPVITLIPVCTKGVPSPGHRIEIRIPGKDATRSHAGQIRASHCFAQTKYNDIPEVMLRLDLTQDILNLCSKIDASSIKTDDVCYVSYGAQMSSRQRGGFGKDFVLRTVEDSVSCKKTIAGRDLYRYRIAWGGKWVEWALADKMYGPRSQSFFETPKLMIRDITGTHRLEVSLDQAKLYCDHTILCAFRYCDVKRWKRMETERISKSQHYSLELLLGILASRLVSAYYYWTLTGEGVRTGGGFHTYPKTIRLLPIPELESASCFDNIEAFVTRMLDLQKRLPKMKTQHDKHLLQRQIEETDSEIDRLVYELYGLNEAEIKLVEKATPSA